MKRFALLTLLASTIALGACTTIEPGYSGIVVNKWGSNRGMSDYTVTTGLVTYNPLSTTVYEWPTFVRTAVWTQNTAEGKPVNEELTFTNKDQMQIAVDVNVAYHLNPQRLPQFYVQFRTDDMDTFTHGYLRNQVRDAFNNVAGRYSIEQIMGDNSAFVDETKKHVQDQLSPFGVMIDQLGIIGAPRPPQSVIANINQKVAAVQLAQQKQNELIQVQADAQKVIAKAEGDAKATLTWAEAQATANRKLSESLTPQLIELKRLEKWNGELPQVNGGSTNPFISIGKQ